MLRILRHATRKRVTPTLYNPPPKLHQHQTQTTKSSSVIPNTLTHSHSMPMLPPAGTIVFNTVGRAQYGFDVFSIDLNHHNPAPHAATDHRLTDSISINFNAQFINHKNDVVFVSERTGSPRFYITRPENKPQPLPSLPNALFHDRPIIKNNNLYFVSTHEQPDPVFTSWSAVYSTSVDDGATVNRLTPHGEVDYSPAVSFTGKLLAVASYRSRRWQTNDFHELQTEIVVFPESDPGNRVTVTERGGWPTWSQDTTIFFHRIAEDGWWSIFRVDLRDSELSQSREWKNSAIRVTPPGLHCFTPAALHDGKRIAVATRRRESNFRHIEIFDLELQTFQRITETINPNFHHYNPFVSLDSRHLGYHRFRGESTQGESTYPHLDKVLSPVHDLQLLRLNGSFPSFSPDGDFIAFNHGLDANGGIKVVKSNGSKRWTLLKERTCFHNAWSPTEKNVIYTSIGPIFESVSKTVQIARIEFDPVHLTNDREEVPFKLTIITKDETGNNAFPSCSPDGKSIVFRSGRSGYKNLYVVNAVEGEFNGGLRRLTEGAWIDTMPCWSPKGDLIVFSSNRHDPGNSEVFGIYLVRPDGSGLRRVEVAKGVEGARERLNHVCFSGDGEWLLFTSNLGGVSAEPVGLPNQFQPYGDLYVVRVDGSGLRRLTCNAYENGTPTWHHGDLALSAGDDGGGEDWDELKGEFQEPLWITCDI